MQPHIQALSRFRAILWPTLVFALFLIPVQAQVINFGASVSTGSTTTNVSFTYQLGVTNNTQASQVARVTSRFISGTPTVLAVSTNPSSTTFTNDQGVLTFAFSLPLFGSSGTAEITALATNQASVTNLIEVFLNNSTNVFTNITLVTLVTNVPITATDLSVTIQPPATPLLVNDNLAYFVAVTNHSALPASSVVLSNILPAGLTFRNISSSNRANISIGTLAANTGRRFEILARALNSGSMTVTSSVSASGITDTNSANNSASATFLVEALNTNQLIATNLTEMTFNPQNALMEQTIRLVNIGSSNVDSARVIVTGLTNWLRNAIGTNNGNPYVAYAAPLAAGQSVDLLMQYFIPTRQPITIPNSSYIAVPTSAYSVTTPPNFTLAITNSIMLPSGKLMLEFPATPGRTYTVLYSDSLNFSNTMAAVPSIAAQADKVQWIDDGPPKTVSFVTNSSMRFYRVLQNP